MEEEKAITIFVTDTSVSDQLYPDDLYRAGNAARKARASNIFLEYHKGLTENTRRRQKNDLTHFSNYLYAVGVGRASEELYEIPESWEGINDALVSGFQVWLENKGYAMGSICVYLTTIKKYCNLVEQAGLLSLEELHLIQLVRGKSGKLAVNRDHERIADGVPTRIGNKKENAVEIETSKVFKIKRATTQPKKQSKEQQELMAARDALLTGLLFEHALRCGEVANLNIEDFSLQTGNVHIYHEKTNLHDKQKLKKHTRIAAENYIGMLKEGVAGIPRTAGPLFLGYENKRITRRAINARVRTLGETIGVKNLSPHDARHFWVYDALKNGTPLDKVQSGGGWKTPHMPLYYAKRGSIANDGVIISEEDDE